MGEKWKKWIRIFLLLCILIIPAGNVQAAAPKLNQKSLTINVGSNKTLKVKNTKKKVSWSSTDKTIATVSSKGVVKGIKAGKATIKAKVSGKTLTCAVKVKNADAKAAKIKLSNSTGGDFVKGISKVTASFTLDNTSTGVKAEILNGNGTSVYSKTFSKCTENKSYSFSWDGKNKKGKYVSAGMYKLRITAGTKKSNSKSVMFYNVSDFAGGDGSKKSPYLVSNLKQLNNVRKYNGRYFKQTMNIDGNDANFTPLFTTDNPFDGIYNGAGHTIENLYFRSEGVAGIFSSIAEDGQVKNLKTVSFKFPYENLKKGSHAGIAAINYGVIYNCSASNFSMTGGTNVGGICGENYGKIENCRTKKIIITFEDPGYSIYPSKDAGGICGYQENGSLINCQSISSKITTPIQYLSGMSGGIIGHSRGNSQILNCSLTGTCSLKGNRTGAIVAWKEGSGTVVTNCYTDTQYKIEGSYSY